MGKKIQKLRQHKSNKPSMGERDKRVILVLCVTAVLLVLAYGVVFASDLIRAKQSLSQGRNNLQSAYQEIEKADFNKAEQRFNKAVDNFLSARKTLDSPGVSVLSPMPVVNKNLLALRQLASTGLEVTLAGKFLTRASTKFFKNGKLDFGFNNGQIDLQPFIAAKPDVDEANSHILMATAEYDKIPHDNLIPPIKRACDELGKQLPRLRKVTTNTKEAFDLLPEILGAKGKRRYFLAIQNNAELRATGGLIGNYGIISVENGKLTLETFDEISKLIRANQSPVEVPKGYIPVYARFKGTSMWQNVNMSPDFPTVGRLLVKLYKSAEGEDLDGVISIDPVGLQYLLEAIGPVQVPQIATSINASNVVDWTLIKAYDIYRIGQERKDFLKDVAQAVWERLLTGQISNRPELVTQLADALNNKHMILYSTHENEQKALENMGYADALGPTNCDYLQVVAQNHGANKVDVYLHENIDYTVLLNDDGSANAKVAVTLTNKAPRFGLPPDVAGADPLGTKGGSSRTYLSIYVPRDARLVDVTVDGKPGNPDVDHEKDKAVFSQYLEMAPEASSTVSFTYNLPWVLKFNGNKLEYILDCQAQPMINDPNIALNIKVPEGFNVSDLPAGMKKQGERVTLNKTLIRDERFALSISDHK